jgi:multisubunit Na+/H+ antiporter MnhB subunit
VLAFLLIFALKTHPSRRNVFFLALAFLLLLSFDYSTSYMGLTGVATFVLYVLCYRWKEKLKSNPGTFLPKTEARLIKLIAAAAGLAVLALIGVLVPSIYNVLMYSGMTEASAFNPLHRPFEDLFAQSARPLSYIIPVPFHFLFGVVTEQFVGSSLYGTSLTEHALYVGITVLVLSFLAFRRWRRLRDGEERFAIGFFLLLVLVAWLFSQPPFWRIGGVRIPMPSAFMYRVLPMYRAYARFGILLMLALSVLAGYGLAFVRERRPSGRVLPFVLTALLIFEFWNWPPYRCIEVATPPSVYTWIEQQDTEAVAEYPLDVSAPNEKYKFFQIFHRKKIVNGALPGTPSNELAATLVNLSRQETTAVLRKMGVGYALVHHDGYLNTGLAQDQQELANIRLNPDLDLVRSFPAEECPDPSLMCVRSAGRIDVYAIKEGQEVH